jgi:hypothetical protein
MTEDFEIDGRVWVDKTSYARGENPQNKPSDIFGVYINSELLQIIYGHRNYPDKWIFNYMPLNIYHQWMKAQTKEEAAKEAVEHCLKTIEELKKGFEVEKTKATT